MGVVRPGDRQRSVAGSRAVSLPGVPGTVAGLTQALKAFGSMPLAQVMAPAIALARDGITVTDKPVTAMAVMPSIWREIRLIICLSPFQKMTTRSHLCGCTLFFELPNH